MLYPTLIIDNFFDNPDEIRNLGLNLDKCVNQDSYPGKRTSPLHELNNGFFNWSTNKIFTAMHSSVTVGDKNNSFNSYQTFQSISPNPKEGKGWIHIDTDFDATAIVYLSKHKNCGTCLYKRKEGIFSHATSTHDENSTIRKEYYGGNKKFDERYFKARDENNKIFEKTITIDSVYNRLLIFDSLQFHGVENFFDPLIKEDRLTLITFFKNIQGVSSFPIPNVRRHI
tara:strand:- start:3723 stop:4403 length:681 start_codon:yes stop_codon:yes gene_type:complete